MKNDIKIDERQHGLLRNRGEETEWFLYDGSGENGLFAQLAGSELSVHKKTNGVESEETYYFATDGKIYDIVSSKNAIINYK